ncbi:MAG: ADP-ribosylglycohydrolase family protein [Spirochaetales bacterium]|nr:ADP-ribosylglycohydrolase family protein [Spirochaetales bacterium]
MNTSQALSRYYLFFAAGDAVGKTTEFMSLDDISSKIGRISGLMDSSMSQNHGDLKKWEVTDDTEQNLWLLRRYLKDGKVTIENTVDALVRWIRETGAVEKKYIGPSSLAALESIIAGKDPLTTGLNGTTCGGIMRSPAAVWASIILGQDIDECIYNALVPTHNTSVAMESAYGYGYALKAAIEGAGAAEVYEQAVKGCLTGLGKAPWVWASAGLLERLKYLRSLDLQSWTDEALKRFLYGVLGTGLPSYETSASVAAIAMHTSSPLQALFLAAETGGDTDTIAALSASLVSMMNTDEELPEGISSVLLEHNDLSVGYET